MNQRVVVTGVGTLNPVGNNVEDTIKAIRNNECGIAEITKFDTSDYKVSLAGEIKDFDPTLYFDKQDIKFNDPFTLYARVAAKQAMKDAGLVDYDPASIGVILGGGIGGIDSIENAKSTLTNKGPRRVSPFFIPMALTNLAAGSIAIDHKAENICYACVSACAAGGNAIGEAYQKIKHGYATIMITGGSEAAITPVSIAGFSSMRALSESSDPKRASIPFDKERNGFVMGEGAGILILESLEHALNRKAHIYGEIIGYGSSCDAHHITAPKQDGSGGIKAIELALKDADIPSDTIEYINAHGTSTPLNDKTESTIIKQVFTHDPYVSSTKSHTGHLLGASGALEAIISIKALEEGFVPATINHQVIDEACDVNLVLKTSIDEPIKRAMSNSLGFGGHNVSLIFEKWEGQ